MSGMIDMRRIRVGMMGMRGISVGMPGIRVAIRGIGMGMQGIRVGMRKTGVGTWRGIKTKGNVCKSIVLTFWYEKQVKKLI